MAKKISQLTQATQVKSDDVTVIVQDGETKKLPLNMMVTKQDIENKKVAGLAKLDEIEATYENDTYTPTITVENKSSVKTGEGDEVDYSANVMDGHVKSAILKGQTLVNVIDYDNVALKNATNNGDGTYTLKHAQDINASYIIPKTTKKNLFKPNTKYLLVVNIIENNTGTVLGLSGFSSPFTLPDIKQRNFEDKLGWQFKTLTTNSDISVDDRGRPVYNHIYFGIWEEGGDLSTSIKFKFMIIEYQEGMENWDIPYFEGMQSVKMPVLTTTGKNLFDVSAIPTDYPSDYVTPPTTHSGRLDRVSKLPIFKLKPNTTYTMSIKINKPTVHWIFTFVDSSHDSLITVNSARESVDVTKTFTTNNDGEVYFGGYLTLQYRLGEVIEALSNGRVQLEESQSATSYEPYKTNILSTPEDLELRGIGNVKDELNISTGEKVERIGEIVLDGSEDGWKYGSGNQTFRVPFGSLGIAEMSNNSSIYVITDRYKSVPYSYNWNTGSFISMDTSKNVVFRDERFTNTQEWIQYLSENPITVQYELATESVKTVDLMPSGTHPSTTPYCWKNGHIQLSSSGLLPNLEYSVVTSRAGQINQNATMIVKNDKRIFDLEILLAGGLVNTTYQALTLQNQVETGLSKVSLNSETEPDYLLYHMIMKLIEEKAYKLDDLTEKVSVFYLYEKLSDEQFETIYSALYPFVEDEIVEEPVVEELPEVVEDEVIM